MPSKMTITLYALLEITQFIHCTFQLALSDTIHYKLIMFLVCFSVVVLSNGLLRWWRLADVA